MSDTNYMNDSVATIDDLKDIVRKFCEDRDWDQYHEPKDLAIGISTEANELMDIFRFKSKMQQLASFKDPAKLQHIREELADTLYFVLRFAQMNHIDLASSLQMKVELDDEKYPVEKAKGQNQKYTEF